MTRLILLTALVFAATHTFAQHFQETITKELVFELKSDNNALMIANINGFVKVTGYDGDRIVVEIDRVIDAKTDSRLEKGKQDVELGVIDRADTLILFVKDGCNSFGRKSETGRNNGWYRNGWGYHWDCPDSDCDQEYDYRMNFTVKVPNSIHLLATTINNGDITVENVTGRVDAYNINGSIRLAGLKREAVASTINGDVDIEYEINPARDCRFYSLNGDINAYFEKGLSASMAFESFNGSFYTNIAALEPLPVRVVKTDGGEGIRFKLTGSRYQIGNGSGPFLDFETFNGNVYLKEKMN